MARKVLQRAALIGAVGLAALALRRRPRRRAAASLAEDVHAGELAVPVNKSQVLRSDRPYAKALIGNPEIADVLPLTNKSLYVLGKKNGTTSLTLYDRSNMLIAVVDVVVGPDVITLKRQLSELMPGDQVGARISNDAVVLEGVVRARPRPTARCRSLRLMLRARSSICCRSVRRSRSCSKCASPRSSARPQADRLRLVRRKRRRQVQRGHRRRREPFAGQTDYGHRRDLRRRGIDLGWFITNSFGIISRAFRAFGTNFEQLRRA